MKAFWTQTNYGKTYADFFPFHRQFLEQFSFTKKFFKVIQLRTIIIKCIKVNSLKLQKV